MPTGFYLSLTIGHFDSMHCQEQQHMVERYVVPSSGLPYSPPPGELDGLDDSLDAEDSFSDTDEDDEDTPWIQASVSEDMHDSIWSNLCNPFRCVVLTSILAVVHQHQGQRIFLPG